MKRLIDIWKMWPYIKSDWQKLHNEIWRLEQNLEKTKHQIDKLRSEYHGLKREKYI